MRAVAVAVVVTGMVVLITSKFVIVVVTNTGAVWTVPLSVTV